ncbi:MAG TPA: TPM domain-containing protein [Candidatus Binatia bacterium]|nr:TPM domain-containing protein [Candidatus Binatia bacterium]
MTSSSRTIARARDALLAVLILGPLAAAPEACARAWPKPQGYVSDFASVMDSASRDSIEAMAGELREKTGAELAVVTLPDLGGDEIEPVAVDLFGAWGIGKKGKDEGVLILLASQERRVKIEVGYGLEGILPDGLCGSIIRQVMTPDLAQGRIGAGLLHGASAVTGVIAKDRGVTITGALPAPGEDGGEDQGSRFPFLVVLFLAIVLSSILRAGSNRRGWMGRGPWGGGGFGGMFGGFGGMGGGFGGGGGGGGGFGGFGGGGSGGGGASGGY